MGRSMQDASPTDKELVRLARLRALNVLKMELEFNAIAYAAPHGLWLSHFFDQPD